MNLSHRQVPSAALAFFLISLNKGIACRFRIPICTTLCLVTVTLFSLIVVSRTTGATNYLSDPFSSVSVRSGGISGRVLTDEGQDLSYITVQCQGLGFSHDQSSEVHTDEEGRFHIEGLSSGVYRLTAWVPGYVPLKDESTENEDSLYRPGDQAILQMHKGGVITGTITGMGGEPAVATRVRAFLVSETVIPMFSKVQKSGYALADDRGIYRIFGLHSGRYLVCAGRDNLPGRPLLSSYDQATTSYFSSSSNGAPSPVEILGNQEAGGINIQLSTPVGHSIRGTVSLGPGSGFEAAQNMAILARAPEGIFQEFIPLGRQADASAFSFDNVADGDYFVLAANRVFPSDRRAVSLPVRVQVRGSDITGIRLSLRPLQTVNGIISLASNNYMAAEGSKQEPPKLEETLLRAFRVGSKEAESDLDQFLPGATETTPNARREFSLNNLSPGKYFLDVRFGNDPVYVRSIQMRSSSSGNPPVDVARSGMVIGQSEPHSRLTIEVARGAARLSGRVVSTDSANLLPPRLRVYLIPSESGEKNNPWCYSEAVVGADGSFHIEHLAPGKYRIVSRLQLPPSEALKGLSPLLWDSNVRQQLSSEANVASIPVDLKLGQELTNILLQFPSAPAAH